MAAGVHVERDAAVGQALRTSFKLQLDDGLHVGDGQAR